MMGAEEAMSGSIAGGSGGGGRGGDTYNIHLTVQGYIGNEQELVRVLTLKLQAGILQNARRNPSNMLSLPGR
jgi:hypothetical protein